MRIVAGLASALAILSMCAAAESRPAVDLATRAQEVIAANPHEYLAAIAEVESVSADEDPLSFCRVRLLEVLGQAVTKAEVARNGEVRLLLVGFVADRTDLRVGDSILFVGVPLWLHGTFSGYSPQAFKRNPSLSDVSEVKGAVNRKRQPGV